MVKVICNEPMAAPDEKNNIVRYEAGQEFEMDAEIYKALVEAGVKLELAPGETKTH
jgi:hypothetical protein